MAIQRVIALNQHAGANTDAILRSPTLPTASSTPSTPVELKASGGQRINHRETPNDGDGRRPSAGTEEPVEPQSPGGPFTPPPTLAARDRRSVGLCAGIKRGHTADFINRGLSGVLDLGKHYVTTQPQPC
ncbi:hypothetical protein AAFF_G00164100 [Aldrovandia affinis]|uniref:Uncharacterized protein n=1 Tax=Aldrovandia affinis TaxID=143900 RepID=A0AAD7SZF2_9TELE|nr:hypothetical protein AAFF_G00164100 [Aldrovandia affinis]